MRQVCDQGVDMIGLNFYDKSPRYCGKMNSHEVIDATGDTVRAGVFVNASLSEINDIAGTFSLKIIQLHGIESLSDCAALSEKYRVIKVLRPSDSLQVISEYSEIVDYILFDAPSPEWGGTGKTIDHSFLKDLELENKILLAGGVNIELIKSVMSLNYPCLAGFDVNSKIELSPGIKDINKVKEIINYLRNAERENTVRA